MRNIKRIVPYACLVLILLLAGILRAWKITENPPELFPDEIVNFVSAKSVVENGHDLQGKLLPYFSDRLEPKPPIYGYTAYMSSKIFGEGTAGIRAPAVFFGLVSILLVFLLAKELFGDTAAALFAAFFMAIIPWHIHYSRVAWDPASFLPFLLLSVYLFYYGINRDRKSAVVSSFGLFALTFYTYHVAPFYSSSFLAFLVVINGRYFLRERRVLIKGIVIFLILLLPYVWTLLAEPHMYDKASRISTFAGGINTDTLTIFFTNYISHFSPDFLFRYGDPNLRHGGGTGVIYWAMLPFLAAGIVYSAITDRRRNVFYFILFWLAVFPLAASLTDDGVPHATRSLAGAPVLCLLSGRGVSGLVRTAAAWAGRMYVSYILYAAVVIISLAPLPGFTKTYYGDYPVISAPSWEYGHKKIFSGIGKLEGKFERACMQNLTYWNEVQVIKYYAPDSKLEFIKNIDDPKCSLGGTIIVQRSLIRRNSNSRPVGTVKWPGGGTAFYVFVIE